MIRWTAVVIVLGFLALLLLGWPLVRAVTGCVPSDFPHYQWSVWGGDSLGTSSCTETNITIDGAAHVFSFYQTQLSEGAGDWAITASDPVIYRIDFNHVRGQAMIGTLWFIDRGGPNAICSYFDKAPKAARQPLVVLASRGGTACSGAIPQSF